MPLGDGAADAMGTGSEQQLFATTTTATAATTLAALPAAGAARGPPPSARATARDALNAWGWQRPATPPAIKDGGFQHYARQEPGAATRRPGCMREPPPPGPFGRRGGDGGGGGSGNGGAPVEGAAGCLRPLPESPAAQWLRERAEDAYARCAM